MNFNKKYFKNKKLQSNTQISLQENNQFNLLRKNNNLLKLLCSILIGCNIKDIINIININDNDINIYILLTELFFDNKYKKIDKLPSYLTLPFILPKHNIYMKNIKDKYVYEEREIKIKEIESFNILKNCKITSKWKNKKISILDYSCGDGRKSLLMKLNLQKENIMVCMDCADILSWSHYSLDNLKKINYIDNVYEINMETQELNFKKNTNNTYDMISIYYGLHHYPEKNIDIALKYLSTLLKLNGIFVVAEHNFKTKYDRMIVDIQHVIFDCVSPPKINNMNNHLITLEEQIKYYNSKKININDYVKEKINTQKSFIHIPEDELTFRMKNVGLKQIYLKFIENSVDCSYYAIYQKII